MTDVKAERLRIIHKIEQLVAAIDDGSQEAVRKGRSILGQILANGSPAMIADMFRGLLLAWDEDQPEWDLME